MVIILALALTITGLAFLNAGVMENSLVRREIHKNQAFYLAEAGVEHVRVKLGKDWNDLTPIDVTPLGAGTYNAYIYTTDSSGSPLPSTKRRVSSTGTAGGISKTVEVIVRKSADGSGITSALAAGGDIIVKGSADIDPVPDPEPPYDDKFINFELGNDPDDGLSLFEEIFGVSKEEMKAIAQSSPHIYYDSAINNDIVENITWVDGVPDQSQITTSTWTGSGIWIVNGNLKITGGTFEGILWVIGSLEIATGNPEIRGTVLVECSIDVDTTVSGNATIELNSETVDDAFGNLGVGSIVESWQEL